MGRVAHVLCFAAGLLSTLVPTFLPNIEVKDKNLVLDVVSKMYRLRWDKHEDSACAKAQPVAIAWSVDLDVRVNALDLVNAVAEQFGERLDVIEPKSHSQINSTTQFLQTMAYLFSEGVAAERYMERELFSKFVQLARSIPNRIEAIGGNAATMAERMAGHGCRVLLGVSAGESLAPLLDPRIELVSALTPDDLQAEDVHISLEFSAGQMWGNSLSSPRTNRFYLQSDRHNSKLTAMTTFVSRVTNLIKEGQAISAIVLAGVQLLEGLPPAKREGRLASLRKHLDELVTTHKDIHDLPVSVHVELASIGSNTFFRHIVKHILPVSDSIGLNEQELMALHSVLHGVSLQHAYPPFPRVNDTLNAIAEILHAARHNHNARVSRIHLHTLHFHAICSDPRHWKGDARSSLAASTTVAAEVACGVDSQVHHEQVQIHEHHDQDGLPIACKTETIAGEVFECCVATGLVCANPVRIAGLGDNVSAAGLAAHLD